MWQATTRIHTQVVPSLLPHFCSFYSTMIVWDFLRTQRKHKRSNLSLMEPSYCACQSRHSARSASSNKSIRSSCRSDSNDSASSGIKNDRQGEGTESFVI